MPKPQRLPPDPASTRVSFTLPHIRRNTLFTFHVSPEDEDLVATYDTWHIDSGGGRPAVIHRLTHNGRAARSVYLSKLILGRAYPRSPNLRYMDGNPLNMTRENLLPFAPPQRALPLLPYLGVPDA